MGAGMILPGLYVGSIRDSRDKEQISKNKITHILSIYEDPKESGVENITYKLFKASDHASQDIKQFFEEAIDFIHSARLNNGSVLVHCLAGVSRSTTLAISYIMTVIEMPWYDSLNVVRAARKNANPNFGFQRQLQNFEYTSLKQVREALYHKYGKYDNTFDLVHCKALLEMYHQSQANIMSQNQQVNCNPVKTYPFAYNQYNLDEEKPQSLSLASSPAATTVKNQIETQPTSSEIKQNEQDGQSCIATNHAVTEEEQETIVNKIFK